MELPIVPNCVIDGPNSHWTSKAIIKIDYRRSGYLVEYFLPYQLSSYVIGISSHIDHDPPTMVEQQHGSDVIVAVNPVGPCPGIVDGHTYCREKSRVVFKPTPVYLVETDDVGIGQRHRQ